MFVETARAILQSAYQFRGRHSSAECGMTHGRQVADLFTEHLPGSLPTRIARSVLAFLTYALATIVVFRDTVRNLRETILGPYEDNLQDLWNTWYSIHHLRSYGDLLATRIIRYPEGAELFYHSFAYPKTLLAALLGTERFASVADLLALQNILLLVSMPLAGLGAFLLIRHFIESNWAALAGGAIFAFNPSHVEHLQHHMHVSTIEFLPFFALCFMLAYERRRISLVAFSILFYTLSALSCWYYLFYCAYLMGFYGLYRACSSRALPDRWQLGVIAAHLAGVVLLLSPLLAPMVASATAGARVYVEGSSIFVADVLGYVAPPPQHVLGEAWFARGIAWRLSGNGWEKTVYLGLGNLLLLAWLFMRQETRVRDIRAFVLCGMLFFMVFTSGDWLKLAGHELLPMPNLLLGKLPFFANIRGPSRAIVFVYLFMAIGVAVALEALQRTNAGHRHARALMGAVAVLLVIDWFPMRPVASPFACPPAYAVIRADGGEDFAILDMPLRYVDLNAAMAFQACHGRPIVGGVVSREPNQTLRDRVIGLEPEALRALLTENKVKYIIVHAPVQGLFLWPTDHGSIDSYRATYPEVYSGPDATAFRVYD
jgi:hypothetical protein